MAEATAVVVAMAVVEAAVAMEAEVEAMEETEVEEAAVEAEEMGVVVDLTRKPLSLSVVSLTLPMMLA